MFTTEEICDFRNRIQKYLARKGYSSTQDAAQEAIVEILHRQNYYDPERGSKVSFGMRVGLRAGHLFLIKDASPVKITEYEYRKNKSERVEVTCNLTRPDPLDEDGAKIHTSIKAVPDTFCCDALRSRIEAYLAKLDEAQRTYLLDVFAGFTVSETARKHGLTEAVVGREVRKAYKTLRADPVVQQLRREVLQ